jgi:polyisoprenoid-binding protein YceI
VILVFSQGEKSMKGYAAGLAFGLLTFTFLGTVAPVRAADAYTMDPVHSSVVFKIRHAGISWLHGRFDEFSGDFVVDKQDAANTSFSLTIKADSIDTNNTKRNDHLRSPDFFNTKQFPALSFKSTSVKPVDDGYEVTGDFTMHGVTKPISFVLRGGKTIEFPKGRTRIGFSGELILQRADFGMTKFAGMLGEDVHVEVGIEAVQKKE